MHFASLKYISVLGGFLAGSKISHQKIKSDARALQVNWPVIKNRIEWDNNWDKLDNKNRYNLRHDRKKHVLVFSFGRGIGDLLEFKAKQILDGIDEELDFEAKFSKIFIGNQELGDEVQTSFLSDTDGVVDSLMFKPINLSDENPRTKHISHALGEAAFRTVFHRPVLKVQFDYVDIVFCSHQTLVYFIQRALQLPANAESDLGVDLSVDNSVPHVAHFVIYANGEVEFALRD